MPGAVINRAWEVLKELEGGPVLPNPNGRARSGRVKAPAPLAQQLPLLATTSPLLDELLALDVSSMTPLEAINKLYEVQEQARQSEH
jgi:DNA mismatch repair protein MutS